MNRSIFTLALLVAGLSLAPAQVQINEAFTGTPDFIELHNCSGTAVDISGWNVTTAYATATGVATTVETGFTLPTPTVIPAGGFLILEEFGTAGTPGTLPNSIAVGFNYFWVANRSLEVSLLDVAGNPIDYMFDNAFTNTPSLQAGHSWTGLLNTPGDVSARNTDIDTNDATDWVNIAAGSETPALLNVGQVFPICGPGNPVTPWYETNDPAASLDLDGLQSSGFSPAITNTVVGNPVTATIDSNVAGTVFEIGISVVDLVRGDMAPGIQTGNGQNINIDLTQPVIFLNGGVAPVFGPFPGTLVLPLNTTAPTTFSAQAFFTDASNADGLAMSQGVQFESDFVSIPGPTSDDGTVLVDLSAAGAAPVTFQGTTFTQIGMNSNGRVTLGAVDGDFSVSLAEATTDVPFFGYWTDFNPSIGGTISMTDDGNAITVSWTNVAYYLEAGSANSFDLVIDRAAGSYSINGLQGITQNPATAVTTSDSVFFGISNGSLSAGGAATDPGALVFDPVTNNSGVSTAADDMLYDFILNTNQTVGTPYRAASIDAGATSVSFTDLGAGVGWIYGVL